MVILKSQNKITDVLMILAWVCPFKPLLRPEFNALVAPFKAYPSPFNNHPLTPPHYSSTYFYCYLTLPRHPLTPLHLPSMPLHCYSTSPHSPLTPYLD